MSLDGHHREELGAYVLGHLDEDERIELEAHLGGCPDCRAELEQVSAVATLLPTVDLDRLEEPLVSPPAYLAERVYERVGQERRREARRRTGLWLPAAAAVLVALFAVSTFLLIDEPDAYAELQPVAARESLPSGYQDLQATATLRAEDYSTQIELEVTDHTPDQTHAVWLEREDGTRVSAGGFLAFDEGPITVYLSAALPLDEAVALVVGTPDDETVLRAHLQGGEYADLIVPDLRGNALEDAIEAADPDFEAESGEEREGTVLDQDPAPGALVRKGATISVTLDDSRASEDEEDSSSDSPEEEDATDVAGSDPDEDAGSASDTALASESAGQPTGTGTSLTFAPNAAATPELGDLSLLSAPASEGAQPPGASPTGGAPDASPAPATT